jgi:hypothetical protein
LFVLCIKIVEIAPNYRIYALFRIYRLSGSARDQVCKNVAELWRGNGAQRNDLAVTETEPPTDGEA